MSRYVSRCTRLYSACSHKRTPGPARPFVVTPDKGIKLLGHQDFDPLFCLSLTSIPSSRSFSTMSRANARTLFEDLGVTQDVVALTTGAPGERHLVKVAKILEKASGHVLKSALLKEGTTALQYGPKQGSPYFREQLAKFLSKGYNDNVNSESLVVTSGATHGLHLVASVLITANAPVFVEDPTYFIAIDIVKKDLGRPVIGVPSDNAGIDLDALEKAFLQHKQPTCEPGQYAGMVYLVPTYHNPRGYCSPPDRCEGLVALARKHNLLLFCDDVYNLLHFDAATVAPPRLLSYDKSSDASYGGGHVISNSSFSKILSPGLRLGWIEGGTEIVKKLVGSNILWSAGSSNHYTSEMVASALELNLQQDYLKELNAEYKEIVANILKIMDDTLPSTVKYNRPLGGYFIWIELPEGSKSVDVITKLMQDHHVKTLPGVMCSASGSCTNCIRISFSHYPPDALYSAVTHMCEAIVAYLKK